MEETTRGASIRLNDRWEIRAYDSMNWQTLEFKPQSGKWKPTGNYFQNIASACRWVWERELKDGGDMDIAGLIERMESVKDEITKAVAR